MFLFSETETIWQRVALVLKQITPLLSDLTNNMYCTFLEAKNVDFLPSNIFCVVLISANAYDHTAHCCSIFIFDYFHSKPGYNKPGVAINEIFSLK